MVERATSAARRSWKAEAMTLDVMPFVGVLLALVVVVIATSPQTTSAATITMPPSLMCLCAPRDVPPTVSVRAASISVNDTLSSNASLVADVCRAAGRAEDDCEGVRVSISADAETRYGDVADAVGLLERGGLKINLINSDMT